MNRSVGAKESDLCLILMATELVEYVPHMMNAEIYQPPHRNSRTCEKDVIVYLLVLRHGRSPVAAF